MLVIVDMQNRILDPNDENYVQGANTIVPKILHRLEKARESGEMVLFTRDIPIEHKNESEELLCVAAGSTDRGSRVDGKT